MKFEHFQESVKNLLSKAGAEAGVGGRSLEPSPAAAPERLPPLALAYIGDAYFNMYVRLRLLSYEQNKVRVLHGVASKMVSAVMQAKAVRYLEEGCLTEKEAQILRRGRNAKSTVPKSASVQEYRYSTGFEAVVGCLFLQKDEERLEYIVEKACDFILREILAERPNSTLKN